MWQMSNKLGGPPTPLESSLGDFLAQGQTVGGLQPASGSIPLGYRSPAKFEQEHARRIVNLAA